MIAALLAHAGLDHGLHDAVLTLSVAALPLSVLLSAALRWLRSLFEEEGR